MALAAAGKCDFFEFRHRLADGSVRDVEVYQQEPSTQVNAQE